MSGDYIQKLIPTLKLRKKYKKEKKKINKLIFNKLNMEIA
jgi:hypothetical protein